MRVSLSLFNAFLAGFVDGFRLRIDLGPFLLAFRILLLSFNQYPLFPFSFFLFSFSLFLFFSFALFGLIRYIYWHQNNMTSMDVL